MPTQQDIYVKDHGGEYVTSTVRGERASCTMSAECAAQRLAVKLFGPALVRVREIKEGNQFVTRWCAEADDEAWASCDDMGQIVVAPYIPVQNTGLAHGPHRALVHLMQQHGEQVPNSEGAAPYPRTGGGVTLLRLVPGVAYVQARQDKDELIHRWLQPLARSNGKRGSLSCWFSTTVVRCAL